MDQDTLIHITLAVGGATVSGLFTAGGFYIYVRMSINHLEQWGKDNHLSLDRKIDKNFETLDKKIDIVQRDTLGDIKGVGSKVQYIDRQGARRYHNLTTALMLAAPPTKESQISGLLKEEAS